jgi:glutamate-5-semialdehyde dehydrogenase
MNLRADSKEALASEMRALGHAARAAARAMREASTDTKNKALLAAAKALRARTKEILAANAEDLAKAKANGLNVSMLDRLALDEKRIEAMAKGVEDVAALPDPVGRELSQDRLSRERKRGRDLPDGRAPARGLRSSRGR